jgi:predicted RNase H-like nuclease (RuvC/YqgF family)
VGGSTESSYTQKLKAQTCCKCGVVFALASDYEKQRREDHKDFKCPNGHPQHYLKKTKKTPDQLHSEVTSLKAENAKLRTKNVRLSAQIDQLEAQLEAGKRKTSE